MRFTGRGAWGCCPVNLQFYNQGISGEEQKTSFFLILEHMWSSHHQFLHVRWGNVLVPVWSNQDRHGATEGSETAVTYTAAATAKSLQSCPTLCHPRDGSPPGSPSLGFSRQEHWSGVPVPSPMHGSEKWKWSCSVVSDSSRPHGLQPTRLLHPWDFPGKVLEWGATAFYITYSKIWEIIADFSIMSPSHYIFAFTEWEGACSRNH